MPVSPLRPQAGESCSSVSVDPDAVYRGLPTPPVVVALAGSDRRTVTVYAPVAGIEAGSSGSS